MESTTSKIDTRYFIWFERSNRWIKFEKPAWFVKKCEESGCSCVYYDFIQQKKRLYFETLKGIYRRMVEDWLAFVPNDLKSKKANQFPAAKSVKQGALPVLQAYSESLHSRGPDYYQYSHRSVRYFKPKNAFTKNPEPKSVKATVFKMYNPDVSCRFTPGPVTEAINYIMNKLGWAIVRNKPELLLTGLLQ